jgi:hypothetical protein
LIAETRGLRACIRQQIAESRVSRGLRAESSREQRAASSEQRAKGREQRVQSREQRAASRDHKTKPRQENKTDGRAEWRSREKWDLPQSPPPHHPYHDSLLAQGGGRMGLSLLAALLVLAVVATAQGTLAALA